MKRFACVALAAALFALGWVLPVQAGFGPAQGAGSAFATANVLGTANQITATVSGANVTLSIPSTVQTTSFQAGASGAFQWSGASVVKSPGDGQITLLNAAGTGFSSLQFGGTTGSFVALQSSGTNLTVGLANGGSAASMVVGAATGGGQGAGTLNAQGLYVNGVAVTAGASSLSATLGVGASTGGHNITFTAGDSIQTSGTDVLYVEGTPLSASGGAADAVMVVDDTRAGSGQGHGGSIVLTIHNATYSYFGGSPQVTLKCWKETGTVNDAATFAVATSNGGFSDDSIKFAVDSLGYVRSAISVVHGWTNSATDATPGTALDTGISRDASSGAGFIDFGNGAPNDKSATLGFLAASMGGKVTKYAAVATAAQGVSAIVAQNSRAAQTASDASLVTFTPAADGSYLISPNLTVTATAVGLSASVAYTDQNSVSRTQTLAFLNAAGSFVNAITSTGAYEGASVRIRVKGGNAITVSTTITSGTFDEDCDIQWVK